MSTSLVPFSVPPSLEQRVNELQQELYTRNRQLADAEEALRKERLKTAAIERGVSQLREILGPMFLGLKLVFGEIDQMHLGDAGVPIAALRQSVVWESWKNKLDPQCGKAIDALLVHGAMTQTQLRIHVGCAQGSIYGVVCRLNKAGIINKAGNKISLKEL